jgi:hypothetical protein
MQSLQLGIWKLIERESRGGVVRELYDVSRDPAERNDRAAEKGAVVDLLAARSRDLEAESRALLEARTRGRRVAASAETRAQLRALGYLGGAAEPRAASDAD